MCRSLDLSRFRDTFTNEFIRDVCVRNLYVLYRILVSLGRTINPQVVCLLLCPPADPRNA